MHVLRTSYGARAAAFFAWQKPLALGLASVPSCLLLHGPGILALGARAMADMDVAIDLRRVF